MISIIVLSSDGYSDCWEPLFMSFKKYFSGIENYELILSTNTKTYSYPGLEINTITHGLTSAWSKRLKDTLDKAKNDIVLVLVEDFFLRSKINSKAFNTVVNLMINEEIDHIRLMNSGGKFKTDKSDFKILERITESTNHRFLYLPGLWKKKVLKKYLVDFEMPYMAEKMGNQRSKLLKDQFYAISQNYIQENGQLYYCSSSGAIYKGKWVDWVIEFLEKHQLEIDLTIRGLGTKEYNANMRNKTLVGLLKTPISTFKSLLSIVLLFFKVKLKFKN